MEEFVLKEEIGKIINGRQVIAAMFYTFNFDPRFFENFIMPILVDPKISFRDEEIYNRILWRKCQKEKKIPPIAVYYDFYAKDPTTAPSLAYDIHSIKMPGLPGKICNFHPKQIFLLLNDKGRQTLILISGSGNITVNGWCDNFETFSVQEFAINKRTPRRVSKNSLQIYLDNVQKLTGSQQPTEAHQQISKFLNYVDLTNPYFNNFSSTFQDFLLHNIPLREVYEVEIISPYYSKNTILVDWLMERGIDNIHCLLPTLRSNEVMIPEEDFTALRNKGIIWSRWKNDKLNESVRNLHSKFYRFYSRDNGYTVLGSVNFTIPAWSKFTPYKNSSNIEFGDLHIEKGKTDRILHPIPNLNPEILEFIEKNELENPKDLENFNRNAPDIIFQIDWNIRKLKIQANLDKEKCNFIDLFNDREIILGQTSIKLNQQEANSLAKNSVINIHSSLRGKIEKYTFYVTHINIQSKPLGFRLNTQTILRFWNFIDDPIEKEVMIRKISESVTDESGVIDSQKWETKLLLNEMATHFSALSQLEKRLFNKLLKEPESLENIQYYLLGENIDTLPFYLDDLEEQYKEGKLQNAFYWMILQIVRSAFYSKMLKTLEIDNTILDWQKFQSGIEIKLASLDNLIQITAKKIPGFDKKRQEWVKGQINGSV